MTSVSTFMSQYWRIIAVATIGGLLAFMGSFLVDERYESSTRLLIHGRDATFLSSTGQDLTAQPGVIDSSLATSLASTYAGIATGRTVATTVVDENNLDEQEPRSGFVATVAKGLAWTYRCGRAFITSGFCAPVDEYEKAVLEIQEGTSVEPLGANAGGTAGLSGSYVLEIRASGSTPERAQLITDAVADELVAASRTRFTVDSTDSIESLQTLVAEAEETLAQRSRRLARFANENGIVSADGNGSLSAATNEQLELELISARAEEADLRARLTSIASSLRAIPAQETERQTIDTGRSRTEVNTSGSSNVYNELLVQQRQLQSELDGEAARVDQLTRALQGRPVIEDNAVAAELAARQAAVERAERTLTDLSDQLRALQITAAQGPADLTRLDEASLPTYPAEPKRYLYLALGLLIGAVAGGLLTALAARRGNDGEVASATTGQSPPDASQAGEPTPNGDGAGATPSVGGGTADDAGRQPAMVGADVSSSRAGPSDGRELFRDDD